ncbi:MAG TPA: methyltransferase [Xanthobacteraceae bacterium]|jgi:tRNA1(Val) A37 N6-methylase TrmN6|nr:methyltransferase [Xanthobacteraceae bacterium]
MSADSGETSEDAVLGGKLVLRQPRRGHRFGHDAILLAASVAALSGERAVELGAGVGAAGLALASRVDGLDVTLVDLNPTLTALAGENIERNGLSDRMRAVGLDVGAQASAFAAAGLAFGSVDHVLMNPPFNAAQNPSPDRVRRMAHVASDATLGQWLGAAARLLRPAGVVTLIWRADGLGDVLTALAVDFGAIAVLPIHGKLGSPAIRVVVRAAKDRNSPLVLLPGFVLADAEGKPTVAAETVLRDGAALSLAQN